MIGGKVADVRRLVHVRYGGPRVCVQRFARVRRQGDLEDAYILCFKSEFGMHCICCEDVLWGQNSGCGAAAGVFEFDADSVDRVVTGILDGMHRGRLEVENVGCVANWRLDRLALQVMYDVRMVFEHDEYGRTCVCISSKVCGGLTTSSTRTS
jgi:hypothetical protein